MVNCIDTNKRHHPKEIIDKTIMGMGWGKLTGFMLGINTDENETSGILTASYENHKRDFPLFTQNLFEEQKLRNSVMQ